MSKEFLYINDRVTKFTKESCPPSVLLENWMLKNPCTCSYSIYQLLPRGGVCYMKMSISDNKSKSKSLSTIIGNWQNTLFSVRFHNVSDSEPSLCGFFICDYNISLWYCFYKTITICVFCVYDMLLHWCSNSALFWRWRGNAKNNIGLCTMSKILYHLTWVSFAISEI